MAERLPQSSDSFQACRLHRLTSAASLIADKLPWHKRLLARLIELEMPIHALHVVQRKVLFARLAKLIHAQTATSRVSAWKNLIHDLEKACFGMNIH